MNNYTKTPSNSFRLKVLSFALSSSLAVSAIAAPQTALALDPNRDVVKCAVLLVKDIINETLDHEPACGKGEVTNSPSEAVKNNNNPQARLPFLVQPEEEPEEEEEEEECELFDILKAAPECNEETPE